jgi:hypothetical protein
MATTSYDQFVASLKAAYEEWENAWQQRHADADQEVIYHYTNAAGILGIVKDRQLSASNAAILNDSTEVVYVRDVLAEVAQELRAEYDVTADMRAYNADAMAGTGRWSPRERRTASIIARAGLVSRAQSSMFMSGASARARICSASGVVIHPAVADSHSV